MADPVARGSHRAPRPTRSTRLTRLALPAPRSGARRFVYGVAALVVAGLLVIGGQGTFAYWSDSATVGSTGFTSGKLDLTVDNAQGNNPSYAKTDLTMTGMVPGESVSSTLAVRNVGDADFTWIPTVTKADALGPALVVELFANATPSASDTTYPRQESCTGGTPLVSGTTSSRLNIGATQNVCVVVTLPTSTPDTFQSATTGSVKIVLAATQVIS